MALHSALRTSHVDIGERIFDVAFHGELDGALGVGTVSSQAR